MPLLTAANVVFSYGDRQVLDGVNLSLEPGQHVGLVGRNGCGKSTLLKMMAGLSNLKPDDGQIQLARGATAGYLRQDFAFDPKHTLREEAGAAFAELTELHTQLNQVAEAMGSAEGDALEKLMKKYERLEEQMHAAGGYAVDHKIEETLHGLGLDDKFFDVKVTDLSGGQKGRLALAKLLLSEPDILLLDEPTNHLDIAGRQWLEQFLAGYRGAVLIISHDRWLLDRVVTKIYELEAGRLVEYPGNYEKFIELRRLRSLEQQRAFEKQRTKIKQEEAFIARYRAGQRAKQAQGREKRLERFKRDETLDAPLELKSMNLSFAPKRRSGDLVCEATDITVRHDEKTLFENFSFSIKRGDRIGIIGPNGAGKSTLLRCLLGEQEPTLGTTRRGAQVDIGYYDQTHQGLDMGKTVVESLQPFTPGLLEQEARNLAGAFLFSGDDQDKPLNVLSGGERARTLLAQLMVGGHNLLVLDEPTNHLDIPSSERLEEALHDYNSQIRGYSSSGNRGGEGTLILITHDRMLLDRVVDQLLIFDGQGGLQHFLGTYSDYVRELAEKAVGLVEAAAAPAAKAPAPKSSPAPSAKPAKPQPTAAKPQNRPPAANRGAAGKLSQQELENRIEQIEKQIRELETQLSDPDTYRDPNRFNKLQKEHADLQGRLTPLEEEWTLRAAGT